MKFSESLVDNILASVGTTLTGFAVTLFDGTEPALASDAITGDTIIMFTVGNDGTTGMTFDTPALKVMNRAAAESVSGTCFKSATPTHFRIHLVGEDPRTADVFYRIQGSCGPNLLSDMVVVNPLVISTTYPLGTLPFIIPL